MIPMRYKFLKHLRLENQAKTWASVTPLQKDTKCQAPLNLNNQTAKCKLRRISIPRRKGGKLARAQMTWTYKKVARLPSVTTNFQVLSPTLWSKNL
jgi:hypothetical protein